MSTQFCTSYYSSIYMHVPYSLVVCVQDLRFVNKMFHLNKVQNEGFICTIYFFNFHHRHLTI